MRWPHLLARLLFQLFVVQRAAVDLNSARSYPLDMPTIALQAHFDGERVVLDEPFKLPVNASLIVTVLPPGADAEGESEEAWLRAVSSSDAFAFLADHAEDIYTAPDGEPFIDAL